MKRWNVVTLKNGERKNHIGMTKDNVSCYDVALSFDLKYNGEEGQVLEIIPLEP